MSFDSDDGGALPTMQVAIPGQQQARADRPEATPGELVGARYKLGQRIGKGGMGEVMAARDVQVARDVAIKRMRAADPGERAIQRFLREAMVQGRLEHPAIVPVHEIGRDSDGLPYFVMKKLAGTSLASILGDRDVPLQRTLRAFADVCLAVEFAHVRGVVHRDLKPDNIMIGDYGETYVLDWGVAKILGEDDGEFADVGSGASGEHVTKAGTAVGTPGYMSPEQVRGASDVDGRSDVYALGCLLFEILAGEPLHPRGTDGMHTALLERDTRPSLRAPGRNIAPELDALCAAATQIDRGKRVQSAREIAERIERFLDGDRDLAKRRELARAHLDKARAAFAAADTPENRGTAMREAAGAIALDPGLEGAAELVGRLMLEPPRETPPEVRDAIIADNVRDVRGIARAGLWAVFGSLWFIPLLWWIAPPGSPYIPALMSLFLLEGALAYAVLKSRVPRPGLVVIGNTLIVILLARMFSPIMIAPGVAASLGIAMVLTPRFSALGSPITVATLMAAGVAGPLVAEQLGLITSTMSVSPAGVLFAAPALSGTEPGGTVLVGGLFAMGLVIATIAMGYQIRSRAAAAAHHLHMQAWQLRQLVPR